MSYIFREFKMSDDLQESIDRFVRDGVPTGGFLQAVLDNNLREACSRADEQNIKIIPAIVAYLYNECPSGCWGFEDAHDSWVERKRKEREKDQCSH